MSGFKRATITIGQEEYRRLHNADMQRRFKNSGKGSSKIRSQQLNALKTTCQQVESRQDHYERLLNNLGDEMRVIETQTSQNLMTAEAAFYENIIAEINEATGVTELRLTSMLDNLQEDIHRERTEYRQNLQECVVQIENWNSEGINKQAIANHWINQADAVYDFINQEFDTNHFAPGRLEKIAQRLALVRMNLDNGMIEAALSPTQTAYLELSDLRVELEVKTLEWQNLFTHAYSTLRELEGTILASSQLPALDGEGNELPVLIDVNLWSDQEYEKLLDQCRELYRRLSKNHQTIETGELRQIVEDYIPEIRHRLDSIIYEARLSAFQAQIRANIAELALKALAMQGFRMLESGYTGDDIKSAYDLHLVNRADGIEVKVKVAPQAGRNYANDIIVISEDSSQRTEHELQYRFNEIRSTLIKSGLTVGPTLTLPNQPGSPALTASRRIGENQKSMQTEIVQDVRTD